MGGRNKMGLHTYVVDLNEEFPLGKEENHREDVEGLVMLRYGLVKSGYKELIKPELARIVRGTYIDDRCIVSLDHNPDSSNLYFIGDENVARKSEELIDYLNKYREVWKLVIEKNRIRETKTGFTIISDLELFDTLGGLLDTEEGGEK
ncbi:hypothetical protein CMI42_03800 [Candidatus Pacearchaeota archaeon]|nr:hypothetical protein [Candidatus Pacearchaeota archaeon]|tara:strand:+ start:2824 stop:3267 length:444 start_codon:yes stop_codon:yes gene_type:complete